MTTKYEGANAEQRHEIRRHDALMGNIGYLLFMKSRDDIVKSLYGRHEAGRQAIIKILGGGLQLPDRVRPAEIGLVNVDYLDLTTGESTTESTTISIDKWHYKLMADEIQVTDESQEDPVEDEDALQTMFDIVTYGPNGVRVEWTDLLSKLKAVEQMELHPEWDRI